MWFSNEKYFPFVNNIASMSANNSSLVEILLKYLFMLGGTNLIFWFTCARQMLSASSKSW